MWRQKEKMTIYEPGNGPSLDTESAATLIMDFFAPEPWEIRVCCLSPPVHALCYSCPNGLGWMAPRGPMGSGPCLSDKIHPSPAPSPFLTSLQPHWPPFDPSQAPCFFQSQGLYMCCSSVGKTLFHTLYVTDSSFSAQILLLLSERALLPPSSKFSFAMDHVSLYPVSFPQRTRCNLYFVFVFVLFLDWCYLNDRNCVCLFYLKSLVQSLSHSRPSINICRTSEEMKKWMGSGQLQR